MPQKNARGKEKGFQGGGRRVFRWEVSEAKRQLLGGKKEKESRGGRGESIPQKRGPVDACEVIRAFVNIRDGFGGTGNTEASEKQPGGKGPETKKQYVYQRKTVGDEKRPARGKKERSLWGRGQPAASWEVFSQAGKEGKAAML